MDLKELSHPVKVLSPILSEIFTICGVSLNFSFANKEKYIFFRKHRLKDYFGPSMASNIHFFT